MMKLLIWAALAMGIVSGAALADGTATLSAPAPQGFPTYDQFLADQIAAARAQADAQPCALICVRRERMEDAAEKQAKADAPAKYMSLLQQYEQLMAGAPRQ